MVPDTKNDTNSDSNNHLFVAEADAAGCVVVFAHFFDEDGDVFFRCAGCFADSDGYLFDKRPLLVFSTAFEHFYCNVWH